MNRILLASCFLLVVFGCGLSPQVVTIDPDLTDAKGKPINPGASFNLSVTDSRKTNVLGSRGGVYKESSIIKTEGDITGNIKQKLIRALEKAGFTNDPSSTNQLNISIIELTYTSHGENRIAEVEVSTEILFLVSNSSGNISKRYKARHKKEVLMAPDEQKNKKLINNIIAEVVQRVLDDQEMLDYIKD